MPETVEYREIEGFPGYRIGDDGSVWSNRNSGRAKTWKRIRSHATRGDKGYLSVSMRTADGRPKTLQVHCLVLETFVGPRPDGMECRHLNGVHGDNRRTNLAWGTVQENVQDKRDHGKITHMRGELNGEAKLTWEVVAEIRQLWQAWPITLRNNIPGRYGAVTALTAQFGISISQLRRIAAGQSWQSPAA